MLNALVIGYGSIGKRHTTVLRELGCDVSIVSHHQQGKDFFSDINSALTAKKIDYAVVATETSSHIYHLETLATHGFQGKVLVEKPLSSHIHTIPDHHFQSLHVAYNLRFHPLLQKLKNELSGQKIISAQLYAGQYLPEWRPEQDYRQSYSADITKGGGALRDLSHELDYALWLFGDVKDVAALGGKLSDLEINSDDSWGILARFEHCLLATIQLNYLDRSKKREIVINTHTHNYRLDLIANTYCRDNKISTHRVECNESYAAQHQAIIQDKPYDACTISEALNVLAFIETIEQAAKEQAWQH